MQKPDGLVSITGENIVSLLSPLQLEDLCGIKEGNATRLRVSGIMTPVAMLAVSPKTLQLAFRSIVGYHWWMRMHGYEDGSRYKAFGSDDGTPQKSFGQSHAMSKPRLPYDPELWQVLAQLVSKMARRLRQEHFISRGVGVSLSFADNSHWGIQQKSPVALFADSDFYRTSRVLLSQAPLTPVRILGVACYDLEEDRYAQQSLFGTEDRKRVIVDVMDQVSDRFGEYVLTSGRMLAATSETTRDFGKVGRGPNKVLDRIAFGKIRQLSRPV
jgi:DNA polymerase-4